MKKKTLIISAIIFFVVILVLVNLLKKKKGIEVETEKVSRGKVIQTVVGSGQIRPEIQVKVSAKVAGKIIKLHAQEGDRVKKNQLLVELDQNEYLAALDRTEFNLLAAKANEKKAKSEYLRAQDLHSKGLISEADFEGIEASYEAAISNTKQQEAGVREARDRLAKTKLHADMDGIITQLNKEEGEMALGAQFQEDVIMVISDLSLMEAAIEVDENDIINVSIGDTSEIEIDAFPDTTFKGIVTQIANTATVKGLGSQEQVTNFEVNVRLIDSNPKFRPGMSTTVDIFTEIKDQVLKVPIQAVTIREKEKLIKIPDVEDNIEENDDLSYEEKKKNMTEVIFCIEDKHAVMKTVKLGISDDTHYEIISGVNEGEEIVTGPFRVLSKTLKNNDLVEIIKKRQDKQD